MKIFAIRTAGQEAGRMQITGWFSRSRYESWDLFFRDFQPKFPIPEAIRAYEAIGYRCVVFDAVECEEEP